MQRVKRGFTLIELLIVVAIIGILAAIAIPNFLNARIRAKVARSTSEIRMLRDVVLMFHNDTGQWLIDGNDGGSEECVFPGEWFGVRPMEAGIRALKGDNHFSGQIYIPLTTPVNYIGAIPTDPFGNGIFYSYEDWGCSNSGGIYGLLAASGPDADNGDWHPDWYARAYVASNGLVSNGDIWYVWKFRSQTNPEFEKFFRGNPWSF